MADETQHMPSRRIVFQGLGAMGIAAVLAGCGSDDNPGATPTTPTSSKTQGGDGSLATTTEVPVGGGIILTDQRIVITQPKAGEFKAFTAVCTHQQNTVTSVSDGEIHCAFHGSVYNAETGQNIGGPALAPLAAIAIKVTGTKITLA